MTEFDDQQKQWLQGFVSGLEARKAADKLTNRSAASRRAVEPAMPCRPPPRTARSRRAASWSPRRPPSASVIRWIAWTKSRAAPRPASSPRAWTSS